MMHLFACENYDFVEFLRLHCGCQATTPVSFDIIVSPFLKRIFSIESEADVIKKFFL